MPRKKKKTYLWLASAGVIILATAIAWGPVKHTYFGKTPAVTTPQIIPVQVKIDPLCQAIENVHLKCPVTPAGEGVMGPGHYVIYPPDAPAHAKVPFSKGDIFDASCVVSGVPAAANMIKSLMEQLKAQEKTGNAVNLPEITYKLDKGFKSGSSLPIPRLPDLTIKAGPNLSEVQEISFSAPNTWLKVIDERRFIEILSKAAINETCINGLINRKYSVISTAAVSQNFEITAKEQSGQSFALSAAIGKGQIQMEGGGDANSNLDEVIKRATSVPVVVGVDFFDPKIIEENRPKLVAPLFSGQGQTRTRANALGQRGGLWQLDQQAPLGRPLPTEQRGGGEGGNNCGGGQQSEIRLTTVVSPLAQDSLNSTAYEFSATGVLTGGFSRSPGFRDLFGRIQGCNPEPQTVQAEVSFDSTVESIVRSDAATTMRVQLLGIPNGNSTVNDWRGTHLERRTPDGGQSDGITNFQLVGAGVYQVRVSGRAPISATGSGSVPVNQRGTFTITVQ